MKIGVAILARDMAQMIPHAVRSVCWADGIYVYDDGSIDGTAEAACSAAKAPIVVKRSEYRLPAFRRGESLVRNQVIDAAFDALSCDLLVSLDADELLSSTLRTTIEDRWRKGLYDSVCFSTWHLFDDFRYLHVFEQDLGDHRMVDPHTRVVAPGLHFVNTFEDGSHPAIPRTENTLVLEGPFHFHLKYHCGSPFSNHSLSFLPRRINEVNARAYLRDLPFAIPLDIKEILADINWSAMRRQDTTHY